MTQAEVSIFEKLLVQLESLHSELTILAKKSPNDAVNTFKLKLINSTLQQCNDFFGEKNRPFAEFKTFSMDDMPSNSDATFILSQYIECAEKFRADNVMPFGGVWWWRIENEDQPTIRTAVPKKIAR